MSWTISKLLLFGFFAFAHLYVLTNISCTLIQMNLVHGDEGIVKGESSFHGINL